MMASLVSAFDLLSSDARVKCIVLTGADPRNKVFCPGMDLDQASDKTAGNKTLNSSHPKFPETEEFRQEREAYRDGGAQVSLAIFRCSKPVIAALNGHAVGVGITMTLACTLRVVSSQARVGFVFARRGLNMEACSSFFLPRIVGHGRAVELVTRGAVLPSIDPALRDLWSDVVPPDRVVPRAVEIAEAIAANTSAVSTRLMRDMIYRGPSSPEESFLLESKFFFDLFRGQDAREGIRSFLEKRDPVFGARWESDRPTAWPWWDQRMLKSKI